jgi:hypothetical protein
MTGGGMTGGGMTGCGTTGGQPAALSLRFRAQARMLALRARRRRGIGHRRAIG